MLGYMEKINDIEGHPSSSHQTLKGTSKWATSLESLLEDPEGVKRFREFLKKEFSEENVLFWLACEEFKKTQGKKQMQEKAKEIYMTFLSSKASSQVNVEGQSRLSETILETPHPLMFQKLQDQQSSIKQHFASRHILPHKDVRFMSIWTTAERSTHFPEDVQTSHPPSLCSLWSPPCSFTLLFCTGLTHNRIIASPPFIFSFKAYKYSGQGCLYLWTTNPPKHLIKTTNFQQGKKDSDRKEK
ncbi:regulator of G-protein signaling 10 isoform X2 [Corvus moneduloides]|uniref:regulator of G-protein signaling 10 isoform X2 n=1 Tax=Corvus moneduloides TaxID=1196302 RepID=UPI001362AFA2|nr:regulator of G-protein signaling 10 isoform X2 [Corvus moneduloides]